MGSFVSMGRKKREEKEPVSLGFFSSSLTVGREMVKSLNVK